MSTHTFKPGDRLIVKFGQGDTATSSGNGIEDGDIVTYVSDNCSATIRFRLDGGKERTAWPERFELAPVQTQAIKEGTQLAKVRNAALAVPSITLQHLADVTGASEAAASARLRDLRKLGYTVSCVKPKGEKQRRYSVVVEAVPA